MLKEILLSLLIQHTTPGATGFSVHVVEQCTGSLACSVDGARWSSFYDAWVTRESRQQAIQRYGVISTEMVASAERTLCRTETGPIKDCKPVRGAKRFRLYDLAVLGAAVAIVESGLREDVMAGRGRHKQPVDGGQGRGPGNEACLMQIHPTVSHSLSGGPPEELLGEENLGKCFDAGLKLLVASRHKCMYLYPKGLDWDYGTISMYGTGNRCLSPNGGKTSKRQRLFRTMQARARELYVLEKREQEAQSAEAEHKLSSDG